MKASLVATVGFGCAAVLTSALALGQDAPKTKTAAPTAAPGTAAPTAPASSAELKDFRAKSSYFIGLNIGNSMKAENLDIDPDLIARGIKDVLKGAKPLLTDAEIQAIAKEFSDQRMSKQMAAVKAVVDKNKKEGDAFLAANKTKPGVVTLPSGLQYKVVTEGTGPMPKAKSKVKAHYRGTLLDGTEFDSSYKRGVPLEIPVDGVIAGWTEALQKMKVGSKWQLFIPSALAYGDNPNEGGPIGPGAVLLFDLELLGVN